MYIFVLLLAAYVSAVYVGWPMNEQLPNVARVAQNYQFTLAPSTYKSSAGGSITYSVENTPQWLRFDPASHTFSGTPSKDDTGTFEVTLIGTDSADASSYKASYSMLVSDSAGVELSSGDVMFTEIAQYGQTNGVDGLVVSQGETFSIQFGESVFKASSASSETQRPVVAYYGRSGDRTSLPNWVHFNPDSRTFSGQVPYVVSTIAPSMEYTFSFIGSDYPGYTGAEGVFKLVVGAHLLSTSLNESIKINGTYGSHFQYTVPVLTSVYLDGTPIAAENISSVAATHLPDYVAFNLATYELTGTFPNASSFQNFSVDVVDVYGNLVALPYLFDSMDSVFTVASLPDVNATRGTFFEYRLMRSLFTDVDDTTVGVDFGLGASWLSYHTSNMTLTGEAPSGLQKAEVSVNAQSNFGREVRSFNVVGIDKSTSASSSSSTRLSSTSSSSATGSSSISSATSTGSSSSPLPINQNKMKSDNHKKMVLGLAIGLPSFAVLLALLLLLFCCCRRRKNATNNQNAGGDHEKRSYPVVLPPITGPGFGRIDSNDDHNETAKHLGALDALKLDNSNKSTLSSMTHVGSDEEKFYDTSEKPMVSWRAKDASDLSAVKKMLLMDKHASGASMSTVNTEKLFSVRLVDDNASMRNSGLTLNLAHRKSMADMSTSRILRDDSSGNIQRLDSDGNLVESNLPDPSPSIVMGSGTIRSLRNIVEEDSTNETFYTQESSDYNLLAKFLGLQNGSLKTTLSDALQEAAGDQETYQEADQATYQEAGQEARDAAMAVPRESHNWEVASNGDLLPSPDAESFLIQDSPSKTAPYLNGSKSAVLSRSSIYSELSFGNVAGDDPRGSKVKLVEFTRKASLRDSSRQQYIDHLADLAQILDDSD